MARTDDYSACKRTRKVTNRLLEMVDDKKEILMTERVRKGNLESVIKIAILLVSSES